MDEDTSTTEPTGPVSAEAEDTVDNPSNSDSVIITVIQEDVAEQPVVVTTESSPQPEETNAGPGERTILVETETGTHQLTVAHTADQAGEVIQLDTLVGSKPDEEYTVVQVGSEEFQQMMVSTTGLATTEGQALTYTLTEGTDMMTVDANGMPTNIMHNDEGVLVRIEPTGEASILSVPEASIVSVPEASIVSVPEASVVSIPEATVREGQTAQAPVNVVAEAVQVIEAEPIPVETVEAELQLPAEEELIEVPVNVGGVDIVQIDGSGVVQVGNSEEESTEQDSEASMANVQAAEALAQIAYQAQVSQQNQQGTEEQNVAEVMSSMSTEQVTIRVIQSYDAAGNQQVRVESIKKADHRDEPDEDGDPDSTADYDEDWEPEDSVKKKSSSKKKSRRGRVKKHEDAEEEDSVSEQQFIVEIVNDADEPIQQEFVTPTAVKRPRRDSYGKITPVTKRLGQRPDVDVSELCCLNCNTSYSSPKTLAFHMNSMHSDKRTFYPCIFCTSVFAQLWGVTRHVVQSHKKSKEETKALTDILRAKAFTRSLDEVRDSHYPLPDYSPSKDMVLPKREGSRNKRLSVIKFSGGFALHKCSQCGKAFGKMDNLEKHAETCAGKKKKRGRRNKVGTEPEQEVEEGEVPAEKDNESEAGQEAEVSKAEETVNSDVYNFEDDTAVVSKPVSATPSAEDLKKIRVEPDTGRYNDEDMRRIENLIDQEQLICTKCRRSYGTISNLRRHAVRHLGWRRFKCTLCKFTAFNRSECKSHLRRIHQPKADKALGELNQYILDLEAEEAEMDLPLGPQRRTMVTESEFRLGGRDIPIAPAGKPKTPGSRTPSGKLVNVGGSAAFRKGGRRSKGTPAKSSNEKDMESLTLDDVAAIEKNVDDGDEDRESEAGDDEDSSIIHVVLVQDEGEQQGENTEEREEETEEEKPAKTKKKSPAARRGRRGRKRAARARKEPSPASEETGEAVTEDQEDDQDETPSPKKAHLAGDLLELFSDPVDEDE